MTKSISLTQGKFALVDDEDFEWLNQWKWYAVWTKQTRSFYAYRKDNSSGDWYNRRNLAMHSQILNTPKGMKGDHKNHDTLDNRRENLRNCTNTQNLMNKSKHKNSTSLFKGVSWNSRARKWIAQIQPNGKKIMLGKFLVEEEAAHVYDEAAKEHFGEFAVLNFP